MLLVQAGGAAAGMSGAELYRDCTQGKGSWEQLACMSYLSGLISGLAMGQVAASDGVRYCFPKEGVPGAHVREIVQKYLRNHPDELRDQASALAAIALLEAFPCPKNSN
jgi:hypothetical protein